MRVLSRLLAVLVVFALPSLVVAQTPAPSLVGTWVSVTGEVGHWDGTLRPLGEMVATLVVTEQVGGVFRGTITYDNDRSGPKFEGKEGIRYVLDEPVLGVVDWDGRTIVLVDYDDETVHRARLVNDATLEVIAYETGPYAVVNRMMMIRQ